MKIALLYEFLSEQGGLEREIINHSKFLIEEGHDVLILTCHKEKKICKFLPFDNLKIEEISLFRTKFQILNLILCFLGLNNLNKYSPDLFISYSFPSNFLIRNLRTKKINYINHYPHFLYLKGKYRKEWANTFERKISLLLSFLFGNLFKKVDKFLVKECSLLFTNSYFTKKKIDLIYNVNTFMSYPPLDEKIKKTFIKPNKKFIFSCGRIVPDKKYDWLIKSVSKMENKIPLYLAGQIDKKYLKYLNSLAKSLNVDLVFLGKLNTPNLCNYYSSAEVFAFPTPGEDFGLVPIESLVCGTPCVVWGDGSGPNEQIINGVNGLYAKPYDLEDFSKKLDFCIETNFKAVKKNSIKKSIQKFSKAKIKKDFIEKIDSIFL